jgi:hypothetical protein
MRLISAIILLLVVTASCNKDKFTTKPQLKIKDINSTEIFGSQTLTFTIRITDKEGDYSPYFGFATKVPSCPASEFTDSTLFHIPSEFINSKNKEGEIVLSLSKSQRHSNLCPSGGSGQFKTDTTTFKFWTRDAAGNVSDTISTVPIIIHYQ